MEMSIGPIPDPKNPPGQHGGWGLESGTELHGGWMWGLSFPDDEMSHSKTCLPQRSVTIHQALQNQNIDADCE